MVSLPFDIDSLAALRQFVAEHAVRVGLTVDRVADLQLAVNELATNTVTHANGPGVLEANAIPGLTDTSLLPQAAEAAGMSFEDLVTRMQSPLRRLGRCLR